MSVLHTPENSGLTIFRRYGPCRIGRDGRGTEIWLSGFFVGDWMTTVRCGSRGKRGAFAKVQWATVPSASTRPWRCAKIEEGGSYARCRKVGAGSALDGDPRRPVGDGGTRVCGPGTRPASAGPVRKELPVYDHAAERAWRHLEFVTYLHARPPRVACPDHGVRQVRLPWAESRCCLSGWRSVERMRHPRGHPDPAHQLGRGVAPDGQDRNNVCDLTHATVEYIADDRKQASLDAYFATVPPDLTARNSGLTIFRRYGRSLPNRT